MLDPFGEGLECQAGSYETNKRRGSPNRALVGVGSMFDMGVYALIRIGWFTKEEPIIHMLPAKHLSAGLGALVLKRFL